MYVTCGCSCVVLRDAAWCCVVLGAAWCYVMLCGDGMIGWWMMDVET